MKNVIYQITALAIIFMLGAGNFAYAASAGSCKIGSAVSQSKEMSNKVAPCCESHDASCQCKIKADSKLFPQLIAMLQSGSLFLSITGFTSAKVFTFDHSFIQRAFSSKSPPGHEPLYTLYSAYRI